MDESEELQFINDNLRYILGFHPPPKCQCSELNNGENKENSPELNKVENEENSKTAVEICQNGQVINFNPLYNFIQTQIEECNIAENIICDDVNNKVLINQMISNRKYLKDLFTILQYDQDDSNDNYLDGLVQKLEYDQNDSFDRSILNLNDDMVVIDQADSSLINKSLPQEDINYSLVSKGNLVNDPISKLLKEESGTSRDQSNQDGSMSGVNVILDILKEDFSDPIDSSKNKEPVNVAILKEGSPDPIDSSKKNEPVKNYLLPFVSEDKKENNDNYDPGWNYLKALETDEERYKFVRECWKSLVVPDPNVNLTFHGMLRRRQRAKGLIKDPGWPNNKDYFMETSGKRKREDDSCIGNPKKKQRPNNLNLNFTTQRIERVMMAVKHDYQELLFKKMSVSQAEKLQKTYNEKIKGLSDARHEVLNLHKFYSGLPDQNMSISQQALENEQWDIEQLYERFKKHYKWNGKQFYP